MSGGALWELGKSQEALREAAAMLRSGFPGGACNRAYYATFHAANAALLAVGAPQPKTHVGTQDRFYFHFVRKEGGFPRELAQHLGQAKQLRNISDYSRDTAPSMHQARDCFVNTKAFICEVAQEMFPEETVELADMPPVPSSGGQPAGP